MTSPCNIARLGGVVVGHSALRWALTTLRRVLVSGQLNATPCWAFTFRMAWAAGWFEEAVTWHTNNLITEHAS